MVKPVQQFHLVQQGLAIGQENQVGLVVDRGHLHPGHNQTGQYHHGDYKHQPAQKSPYHDPIKEYTRTFERYVTNEYVKN